MVYVISDTHFGHSMLVDRGYREEDFEQDIIKKWNHTVKPIDTVIHCGDWSMGRYRHYSLNNSILMWRNQVNGNVVLIRGNHDKNPCSWYMRNGFVYCADYSEMVIEGKKVVFSHVPVRVEDGALNIHGHLHNNNHRLNGDLSWYNHDSVSHFDACVDNIDFRPQQISTVFSVIQKRWRHEKENQTKV